MKTYRLLIVGILLFIAGGFFPPIYRRFFVQTETSEAILLFLAAPLVLLSMGLIVGGVLRVKNDRSSKDGMHLDSSE